jgi:MFS transporter, UMF1 family
MTESVLPKNDRRLINRWAMYDWANSVYSLVINSAIFPIYYNAVTSNSDNNRVNFFGAKIINTSLYSFAISFSFLLVACISPVLSSIADYRRSKLRFMQFFCYLGSLCCILMYWFDGPNIYFGIFCVVFASVGYCGSIVFYNSYLPEIADEEKQDNVSAKGFAYGYFGSVFLLLFNLVMIEKPSWFGFNSAEYPTRISFLLVGVWWILFAQLTFNALRRFEKGKFAGKEKKLIEGSLLGGYHELIKVLKQLKKLSHLKYFLLAFFFYSMGLNTVMLMATLFGTKELHLPDSSLIITILLIQIVAIGGSYFLSFLSGKIGNIRAIIFAIFIWIIICVFAYFVQTAMQFYVVAFLVGLVMGGIQSLSRSTYSKFLPETEDHASFFSFYDVAEKLAIVIGTFSYGIIEEVTGSMRNSVFALIIFFVVGLIAILFVRKPAELEPHAS